MSTLTTDQMRRAIELRAKLRPHKQLMDLSDYIRQGKILREIRAIDPGRWGFIEFIRELFPWGKRYLFIFINIVDFVDRYKIDPAIQVHQKVIALLAEPTNPKDGILHVLQMIREGAKPTYQQTREIMLGFKGSRKTTVKQHCPHCAKFTTFRHSTAKDLFICRECKSVFDRKTIADIVRFWQDWLAKTSPVKQAQA